MSSNKVRNKHSAGSSKPFGEKTIRFLPKYRRTKRNRLGYHDCINTNQIDGDVAVIEGLLPPSDAALTDGYTMVQKDDELDSLGPVQVFVSSRDFKIQDSEERVEKERLALEEGLREKDSHSSSTDGIYRQYGQPSNITREVVSFFKIRTVGQYRLFGHFRHFAHKT